MRWKDTDVIILVHIIVYLRLNCFTLCFWTGSGNYSNYCQVIKQLMFPQGLKTSFKEENILTGSPQGSYIPGSVCLTFFFVCECACWDSQPNELTSWSHLLSVPGMEGMFTGLDSGSDIIRHYKTLSDLPQVHKHNIYLLYCILLKMS